MNSCLNDLIGSLFAKFVFLLVIQHIRKSIYWRNKDIVYLIFPWLSLELVEFPDFSLISLNFLIWKTPCDSFLKQIWNRLKGVTIVLKQITVNFLKKVRKSANSDKNLKWIWNGFETNSQKFEKEFETNFETNLHQFEYHWVIIYHLWHLPATGKS